MKPLPFFTFFIFVCTVPAISQSKKDLVGAWYKKIPAYQFIQHGTAQCYTKSGTTNYKQKLIIDKNLNYTYIEFNASDTIENKGHVSIQSDTIKFVQTQTNHKTYESYSSLTYFLFHLDSSQLIYSNFAMVNSQSDTDENDKIFMPVETKAEYKPGMNQFLKSLYSSLSNVQSPHTDSVFLHSYNIVIDKNGNADISTLKALSARTEYLDAIKQGIVNLKSGFIPAKQNGKPVTAILTFTITF